MKRACLVLGAWCLVGAREARGQDTTLAAKPVVPLLVFGAAAALALPADEWLAQTVRRPAWVRTGFGHDAASAVSLVGSDGLVITAVGMYGYGWLSKHDGVRDMGGSATKAMVASSVVTSVLKIALGRSRPFVTADSNAHDFQLGRGWRHGEFSSMPSGHATAAFAFAAAISEERARLKGRSRGFDVAAYGGATLVALSRMMLDRHWASDVLLGAGIGTTAGLVTVRLAH